MNNKNEIVFENGKRSVSRHLVFHELKKQLTKERRVRNFWLSLFSYLINNNSLYFGSVHI
ncbi:hypothetical protein EZS27_026716 [termite gut metagenome]|uniref:Uncharacterized protein n=1 Tax=termite gut metagenome TaxID=433724 RepID=A0A5J4QTE0_9ZZZZ